MRPKGCGFSPTVAFARLGGAGRSGRALVSRFRTVLSGAVLLGALLTASICLAVPQPASAQNASPAADALAVPADVVAAPLVTATDHPPKPRPESEITVEGLVSYGNYHIFASGENCKLYDVGIEYDRHYWGHLFKARVDYVAEVMPMVLLNQPKLMGHLGQYHQPEPKDHTGVDHLAHRYPLAVARRQDHQALPDGQGRRSGVLAKAAFKQDDL
ncbi:MAG: hypothetical protein WDM87_13620 [Terracidiphilus sp.]